MRSCRCARDGWGWSEMPRQRIVDGAWFVVMHPPERLPSCGGRAGGEDERTGSTGSAVCRAFSCRDQLAGSICATACSRMTDIQAWRGEGVGHRVQWPCRRNEGARSGRSWSTDRRRRRSRAPGSVAPFAMPQVLGKGMVKWRRRAVLLVFRMRESSAQRLSKVLQVVKDQGSRGRP